MFFISTPTFATVVTDADSSLVFISASVPSGMIAHTFHKAMCVPIS